MSSFSCSFFSKQCLQNFTTTYIKRIKSTSTIHIHIFEILTPCTVTNPPKIPAPIPAAFLASKRHLSGMPFAHYLSLSLASKTPRIKRKSRRDCNTLAHFTARAFRNLVARAGGCRSEKLCARREEYGPGSKVRVSRGESKVAQLQQRG